MHKYFWRWSSFASYKGEKTRCPKSLFLNGFHCQVFRVSRWNGNDWLFLQFLWHCLPWNNIDEPSFRLLVNLATCPVRVSVFRRCDCPINHTCLNDFSRWCPALYRESGFIAAHKELAGSSMFCDKLATTKQTSRPLHFIRYMRPAISCLTTVSHLKCHSSWHFLITGQ